MQCRHALFVADTDGCRVLLVRNNSVPYAGPIALQELQLFDMQGQQVGGKHQQLAK